MPKATVSTEATRYDLKTLPGGFVELKALPFGKMLERREKASRMSMDQQAGNRRNANQRINFDLMQRWARNYEFQHCIVDHNLEDDDGNKLNFSLAGTLDILDPKIGAEIEGYIDDLNQEEEEDLENFTKSSTSASKEESETPSGITDLS
jgi:hypothetical protein